MWAVKMQSSSLDQPLDLQIDAGIDERVEILVGVFKGQRIGIGEIGRDVEVEFGWESREVELWNGLALIIALSFNRHIISVICLLPPRSFDGILLGQILA